MSIELDYMEYATNLLIQAAYLASDAYGSEYPTHDTDHVKATTFLNGGIGLFYPHFVTDPAKSLTGSANAKNSWHSGPITTITNQRFHIDLGSAKIIRRIYYENFHHGGTNTTEGANNFTFWGSNNAAAFAELTYGTDTNWTQLTISQSTFDEHIDENQVDPKYITVTNNTAYRYYAFKFADNHGHANYMSLRRIELQILHLQCYSEDTIKEQGDYSLKGIAVITGSLNKTLTRTVDPTIDLTDIVGNKLYIRASRTGSNIKIGIKDSGGVWTEITPNVATANVWQGVDWDISAVSNVNKDVINTIRITIDNADSGNVFYLDNIFATAWDKTYIESISLTDSVKKTASKTFSETIALSDILIKKIYKTFTESLSLTDIYSRVWNIYRTFTETLNLADTLIKQVTYDRANKLQALESDKMFPSNIVRNIQHGLDVAKTASPVKGDWYIAINTTKVYVCFLDGTWVQIYP